MENTKSNTDVQNVQAEMMLIGAIYSNQDLLLEVSKVITRERAEYYFTDEVTRFLYDCSMVMYKRGYTISEKSVVIFMSEDKERVAMFKKMGGYRTINEIISLANPDDFNSYFETVKKYSLIREYVKKGIDVSLIIASKKFQTATANEVYYRVRSMVDSVHTDILAQAEIEYPTEGAVILVNSYLTKPDLGTLTAFEPFNRLFRGFKAGSHLATGMLSNAGKTRLMLRLACYNAFIGKQKTMVLLNETDFEDAQRACIVSVLNNREFQVLHGVCMTKPEDEIRSGLFRDRNGNLIERTVDESDDEYVERVQQNSQEYHDFIKVVKWFEENQKDYLAIIDVASRYDDETLETYLRKHAKQGYTHFFYDTLKADREDIGQWGQFKKTATLITEVAKSEGVFLYSSIQLTDDSTHLDSDELTSTNIASSKQIKHILDGLCLCSEIKPKNYGKYTYEPCEKGWGEDSKITLPLPDSGNCADKLFIFNMDKNRVGQKKKILVRANLDLNTWDALGYVTRKGENTR